MAGSPDLPEPVIELQGVDFAYGREPVLSGVNLSVSAGDFVALLGPNGGGKTTLVRICLGLLKPDSGSVKILGRDASHGLGSVLGRVGYVPQEIKTNQDFPITAWDLVLTGRLTPGARRRGWSKEDRAAAQKALERVGLWSRRNWRLGGLSGGQRQRVMIARALACGPELLFLDEPTASVDSNWQTRLYELFRDLTQKATVVMVSHDLTAVSSYVKSVACVNRLVHYHPRPEITPELLRATYNCPVELIAHGIPHRVLGAHEHGEDGHA